MKKLILSMLLAAPLSTCANNILYDVEVTSSNAQSRHEFHQKGTYSINQIERFENDNYIIETKCTESDSNGVTVEMEIFTKKNDSTVLISKPTIKAEWNKQAKVTVGEQNESATTEITILITPELEEKSK